EAGQSPPHRLARPQTAPSGRCGEGQERDVAGSFDRFRQQPLVRRAGSCEPTRHDLSPLGDELAHQLHVLVIDNVDLLGAELAHLATPEILLPRASWTCRSTLTSRRAFTFAAYYSRCSHDQSLLYTCAAP